jgi:hypothetical protein
MGHPGPLATPCANYRRIEDAVRSDAWKGKLAWTLSVRGRRQEQDSIDTKKTVI